MDNNLNNLANLLKEINKNENSEIDLNDNKTWHLSHRRGPTGIGKTFEDLIGKQEDNLPLPDFEGIELKAHDKIENSYITLFTKSPVGIKNVNTSLRNKYGYINNKDTQKVLHTSVSSKGQYNAKSQHYFKIINNEDKKALMLNVYDKQKNNITEIPAEWTYEIIKNRLNKKLKNLAIINTEVKKINSKTYYSYNSIEIIHKLSLQQLLNAFKDNKLIVDLRLGVYKSGKKIGKTHDHGTGFRIKYEDLKKYSNVEYLYSN